MQRGAENQCLVGLLLFISWWSRKRRTEDASQYHLENKGGVSLLNTASKLLMLSQLDSSTTKYAFHIYIYYNHE